MKKFCISTHGCKHYILEGDALWKCHVDYEKFQSFFFLRNAENQLKRLEKAFNDGYELRMKEETKDTLMKDPFLEIKNLYRKDFSLEITKAVFAIKKGFFDSKPKERKRR